MEVTFKISPKEDTTVDVAPSEEQIAKARAVCRACNESLDLEGDFEDHADNDSCIEDSYIDQYDTGYWCEGCRAVFNVQRRISLKE